MPKVQSKTLFEMPTLECSIKVFHGDNLEILQAMPANSIDSIVTDPPYGLGKEPDAQEMLNDWVTEGHHDVKGKGFMGKEWDAFVPQPIFWRECLRVLKPGGYLLSFAGTRTQDLMALGLRIAGFEIRDMIAWVYGCLSDDSEVLTKYGWERYNKAIHEEILAYDPEADVYQWERPSRWSEYRVESDTAYRIKSDQTDQIVSRGHRCLVERGGVLAFVPADKLSGVERVPYLQGDVSALSQGRGELLLEAVLRQGKKLVEAACGERQRKEVPKQGACWGEKPGMEGRADLFQSQGQVPVSVDQVRSLPLSVHGYVSQGRLRHGASATCGDGTGAVAVAERVRASCQSQCNRQQDREPDAVRVECGPQTVRTRTSYRTTLATVTPIKYTGLIFCPTVSTGAFVARRNGKVFVTGNSGFPKSLDVSKAIDKVAGAEREVVGKYMGSTNIGRSSDGKRGYGCDGGATGGTDRTVLVTAPATDAARQWQGWGTALKPALEPITVARKPLVGTVAENVLTHGTGALNIDGCRVEGEDTTTRHNSSSSYMTGKIGETQPTQDTYITGSTLGRWPANLIHDGSEEVIKLFPSDGNDSAARFFYSPKVGKEEREFGMDEFDSSSAGEVTSRKDGSQGLNSPRAGAGRTTGSRNVHPTVKPVDLMRYLCRLVTPPGGIVLDPFAGSGTTGIAATIEKFRAILIEREDQYAEICRARVGAAKPMGNGDLWEAVASVSGKGR